MDILFLHNNFPGQFRYLAQKLAADLSNDVIFLSNEQRAGLKIENVKHYLVKRPSGIDFSAPHPIYSLMVGQLERSIFWAKALNQLKRKGYYPDLICCHPGWGNFLFVKDIFPKSAYVLYCEWYYTKNADFNFFHKESSRPDSEFGESRIKNFCQLNALHECDFASSPTYWQRMQYPKLLQECISVLYDGIDTEFFQPTHDKVGIIKNLNLNIEDEIVTYTARGFEPYRGFEQFYHSIPFILDARPRCHVIIMGEDSAYYGEMPKDGRGYAERLKQEYPLEPSRVHFINFSSYQKYLSVLQISSVHVYLTAPFVLSWSMLEAMSCGCTIVASNTKPVQEFISDGDNGLITDFWDSKSISDKVIFALENKKYAKNLGKTARRTILDICPLNSTLEKNWKTILNAINYNN